jgi:hypothetical protein
MTESYEAFCVADAAFYDSPEHIEDAGRRFVAAERPAPQRWTRQTRGGWIILRPPGVALPGQGWKIHVSATLPAADRVIDIVWEHCIANQITFKFLRSRPLALVANSKYANRGSSGKLMTLYPTDELEFAAILRTLSPKLDGFAGPYILSDLRYGEGPLFVRYGAFSEMWCHDDSGDLVPALRMPNGHLVPDRRQPAFYVPEFITLPEILRPHLAARASGSPSEDFPYAIERPLHFSNGGGVYLARHLVTGDQVVLREARPHAGLDGNGRDAVARLCCEREILHRLDGIDCVPRLLGHCIAWEHHFLVQEYIEGERLLDAIIARYPLVHPVPTKDDLARYVAWATGVIAAVGTALDTIHAHGVRFGDLHPGNVVLRSDGRVALVDFEVAADLADDPPRGLGAPGFTAPAGMSGVDVDRYALECLRLMVFLPVASLLGLDPSKNVTLAKVACEELRLVAEDQRQQLLAGPFSTATPTRKPDLAGPMFMTDSPNWPAIRDSLIGGIHASATPHRDDRLFPGDPRQFAVGGATLAFGAAGVLLGLAKAGEAIPEAYVNWLERSVARPHACAGHGLYDGLHGVAAVLDTLGRRDSALDVLDRAGRGQGVRDIGLFGGRAGIAMNLLHFARLIDDDSMHAQAVLLGDQIARVLHEQPELQGVKPGLMRGMTGVGLLFLHLYEATGESHYLDLAEAALRRDLAGCVTRPTGASYIVDGTRRLSYLADGAGGIAVVLAEYLQRRESPELAEVLAALRRGCWSGFVLHPGLFEGRAGLMAALSGCGAKPDDGAALTAHIRRLGWHALVHEEHLAFPGSRLRRLSMDLATGSAGILLALQSAFAGTVAPLPYLDPCSSLTTQERR